MSCRYCIGRKTIASTMHAADIAKYSYYDITDDCRISIAKDIRNEINSKLVFDLDQNLYKYKEQKYEYNQDILSNIVYDHLDDISSSAIFTLFKEYDHFIPWIKLANSLDSDCHKLLAIMGKYGIEYHMCFPYPFIDYQENTCEKRWIDLQSYLENPYIDQFIDSKYILDGIK